MEGENGVGGEADNVVGVLRCEGGWGFVDGGVEYGVVVGVCREWGVEMMVGNGGGDGGVVCGMGFGRRE